MQEAYWGREKGRHGEGVGKERKAISDWGHKRGRQADRQRDIENREETRGRIEAREAREEEEARECAVPGGHFCGVHMACS